MIHWPSAKIAERNERDEHFRFTNLRPKAVVGQKGEMCIQGLCGVLLFWENIKQKVFIMRLGEPSKVFVDPSSPETVQITVRVTVRLGVGAKAECECVMGSKSDLDSQFEKPM